VRPRPLQALGIALKLTFQGDNQLLFSETYVCVLVSALLPPRLPAPRLLTFRELDAAVS
jgi:hypothetical protein